MFHSPKRRESALSSFVLRLIALVCMCVDHAGLALFPSASAFRCVGRLAFPLYCFLLAQGFAHTRDIRAYARRLLLLACVSELPFDLLIFGRLSSAMEQNVVFSLLLGLLALCAARALSARPLPCALSILALMLLAMVTQVSFGWLGVALCGRRQKASGAFYRAPYSAVFRFAAVFRRGARLGDDFPLRGAVGRSDSAL